jgi:hypothetical protein
MRLELSDTLKKVLTVTLLLLLPWVILAAGIAFGLMLVWFFLIIILWIGLGIIFYSALSTS